MSSGYNGDDTGGPQTRKPGEPDARSRTPGAGGRRAKNRRYISGPNPRTVLRNKNRRFTSFGPGHRTTGNHRSRTKTRDVAQFGWCRRGPEKTSASGRNRTHEPFNQSERRRQIPWPVRTFASPCARVPAGVAETGWSLPLSGDDSRTNKRSYGEMKAH